MPAAARKTIRDRKIGFFIIDAFSVAKKHAPTPELEIRMMGIAFIGAIAGHVARVSAGASADAILEKIRQQISKKFGAKGGDVVVGNMAVIREAWRHEGRLQRSGPAGGKSPCACEKPQRRDFGRDVPRGRADSERRIPRPGLLRRYDRRPVPRRHHRRSAGAARHRSVHAGGSAAFKDKGMFRRDVPELCDLCAAAGMRDLPDAAIPNTVHDIHDLLTAIGQLDRETQRERASIRSTTRCGIGAKVAAHQTARRYSTPCCATLGKLATLTVFPVADAAFHAMERRPGNGLIRSRSIRKCTVCLGVYRRLRTACAGRA
jgi:pyruvate-ferredoxin/flavodoxin oxidoreductase